MLERITVHEVDVGEAVPIDRLSQYERDFVERGGIIVESGHNSKEDR